MAASPAAVTCRPPLPLRSSLSWRRRCLATPQTTTVTEPRQHGLVFTAGDAGSWDAAGVSSPVVKPPAGGGAGAEWLMWYASANSIGLAASADGVHWNRNSSAAVLEPNGDWWAFDTANVRPSDVLVMSSSTAAVYWMYYSGLTPPSAAAAAVAAPGLAVSQDGKHWARIEGDHHTGALIEAGAAPKVVVHGDGDLRMYHHLFDETSGCDTLRVSRSRDGIRWTNVGQVLGAGDAGAFDEAGVRNGHVVRDERRGRYVMAYEGVARNGTMCIGLAESANGLKGWSRCSGEAVLQPSAEEDGWDCAGVGSPYLVKMDREEAWRVYYAGVSRDGKAAIGMAVSEGLELGKLRKCGTF